MTTVLIADDQALVRAGFRLILELEVGMEVVGEATDGKEVLRLVAQSHPDVVLMDVQMPGMDGIEATRALTNARSTSRVLMLTTFDTDDYVYAAMRAGASGFLLKDAPRDQLISAIRIVDRGESLLAPSITRRFVERFVSLPPPDAGLPAAVAALSAREREVLELLALGMSNVEIAGHLVLGEATVKTHVAGLLSKLELRDRLQAVVFAYESGFVRPGRATVRRRA